MARVFVADLINLPSEMNIENLHHERVTYFAHPILSLLKKSHTHIHFYSKHFVENYKKCTSLEFHHEKSFKCFINKEKEKHKLNKK